ncbi:hypothetical protein [Alienimonas chondri]|uniref:Uncharacterized protein n=1 Tax=Alienimonas chondri TaxID=2681879 RepID=A0ABX1VG47_9PLAN|nr:hypothetical protein [Alienimonas chondri]NNJ27011.1 hypothetical protein [Alienimonas chondri]
MTAFVALCFGAWGLLVAGGGTAWYWWKYRDPLDRPDDYMDNFVNGLALTVLSAAVAMGAAALLTGVLGWVWG